MRVRVASLVMLVPLLSVPLLSCGEASNGILEVRLTLPPGPPGTFVRVQAATRARGDWTAQWAFPRGNLEPFPLSDDDYSFSIEGTGEPDDLRMRVQFCNESDCSQPVAEVWYELDRPFVIGHRLSLTVMVPEIPSCTPCSSASQCTDVCGQCAERAESDESFDQTVCPVGTPACECTESVCTTSVPTVPPRPACVARAPAAIDPTMAGMYPCVPVANPTLSGPPTLLCTIDRCRIAGCPDSGLVDYCEGEDTDDEGERVHLCEL